MSFLSFPNSRKPKQDNETIDPKFHSLFFLSMFSETKQRVKKRKCNKTTSYTTTWVCNFLVYFLNQKNNQNTQNFFSFLFLAPHPPTPLFLPIKQKPTTKKKMPGKQKKNERESLTFLPSLPFHHSLFRSR